ncbi:MAG: hypothetical protein VKL39_06455 [Leptolyngbyaceae bacterium]|nr:hypothetical protein [Leptolyngbyaceae bacterium]
MMLIPEIVLPTIFLPASAILLPPVTSKDLVLQTILNLLAEIWFIAFLVESFIEIILKITGTNGQADKTKKIAVVLALLISLCISLVGIRAMEILFNTSELGDTGQNLFRIVDITLTAGLIAGGTAGIHELAKTYQTFVEAIRTQLKP